GLDPAAGEGRDHRALRPGRDDRRLRPDRRRRRRARDQGLRVQGAGRTEALGVQQLPGRGALPAHRRALQGDDRGQRHRPQHRRPGVGGARRQRLRRPDRPLLGERRVVPAVPAHLDEALGQHAGAGYSRVEVSVRSTQTVLVVEDESSIASFVALYLKNAGYAVRTAANGAEALAQVAAGQPALIVLDLMLPDIDGIEVCRRIRKTSDVPILMLTARDEDVDKIIGLEVGADDYLTKPFNPRELVARVKSILRRATPE